MENSAKHGNRRGRKARVAARAKTATKVQPFIKRKIPLSEMCSDEGLQIIEDNADTILKEIGIEFQGDKEVLTLFKGAGADIKGTRVRFEKGMLRAILKTAPSEYMQHARNSSRSVVIGGSNLVIAPVYGPCLLYTSPSPRD